MKNAGTQVKCKPCKLCPSKRYANLSLCYFHYRENERKKRDEKVTRKLERKLKTKKYQKSETKKWHVKAWLLMSEWVRRNGAGFSDYNTCFTCEQQFQWRDLHAGHYQHGKLDFDERNLKPQCVTCNLFFSGRLDAYTMKLVRLHGIAWVEQLRNDASKDSGYTLEQLKSIHGELKTKLEHLRGPY